MKEDLKMYEPSRKSCPACGAVGKDLKEVNDLTRILYHHNNYHKTYCKKNVCKKCAYEWF